MEHANNNEKQVPISLDEGIIDKAKAADINVAAISEQLLKSITYESKGNTTEDVAKAYETLFDATLPLLVKYDNANVEVGRNVEGNAIITIYPGGPEEDPVVFFAYFPLDHVKQARPVSIGDVLTYLYKPKIILENIILAISKGANKNQETIRELDFALGFVKVLEDVTNNNSLNSNDK
jgi:hypothetical protein